jgi:hypothetical protein
VVKISTSVPQSRIATLPSPVQEQCERRNPQLASLSVLPSVHNITAFATPTSFATVRKSAATNFPRAALAPSARVAGLATGFTAHRCGPAFGPTISPARAPALAPTVVPAPFRSVAAALSPALITVLTYALASTLVSTLSCWHRRRNRRWSWSWSWSWCWHRSRRRSGCHRRLANASGRTDATNTRICARQTGFTHLAV